jgi:hypothetical protein
MIDARSLFAALAGAALALAMPPAVRAQPTVTASVSGPPQEVFDSRAHGCEAHDIPDTVAHAFRDDRNMVHLVASNAVNRAMVGPTLDTVKQDCSHLMYRSLEDPDPSHFTDRNWLASFFSIDGRRVVSLVHSEYDPWTLPSGNRCPFKGTREQANCWWVSVNYALSNDGGYSFTMPPGDQSLVAAAPYVWNAQNRQGPMGYRGPTNILQVGNEYYAMINTFKFPGQEYGPCLIRTSNLLDPKSWRAWNGRDFGVQFIDPYVQRGLPPEQHTCKSVMAGEVNTLAIDLASGKYVAMLEAPDRRYGGEPGTYLAASADLIHWSRPSLVVTEAAMLASEPHGRWADGYSSILDPLSTDRNFSTVTASPYLYYVRQDRDHPPWVRALFRRRMTLHVNG